MTLNVLTGTSCHYTTLIQTQTLSQVDRALEPGLVKLTWTSISIDDYVSSVYAALGELELLMDRANDLVEYRIDAVLHDMATTTLCQLPDTEPWTVDEFLEKTQVQIVSLEAKGSIFILKQ